jgi:hypothetical protein
MTTHAEGLLQECDALRIEGAASHGFEDRRSALYGDLLDIVAGLVAIDDPDPDAILSDPRVQCLANARTPTEMRHIYGGTAHKIADWLSRPRSLYRVDGGRLVRVEIARPF